MEQHTIEGKVSDRSQYLGQQHSWTTQVARTDHLVDLVADAQGKNDRHICCTWCTEGPRSDSFRSSAPTPRKLVGKTGVVCVDLDRDQFSSEKTELNSQKEKMADFNACKTVNDLLEYWASTPDWSTPAFVSINASGVKQCLNRREIYQFAKRFAQRLVSIGVKKGTIICNTLPNSLERIVCEMGIMFSGAISMNGQIFRADGQDFFTALKSSKCEFIVLDPTITNGAWQFLESEMSQAGDGNVQSAHLPDVRMVVFCPRDKKNPEKDFLNSLRQSDLPQCAVDVSLSDIATIMTTSGSTGYSKLVTFTHSNLYHFGLQVKNIHALLPGDRFMNCAPLGWAGGYPQWYLSMGVTRYFVDMHDGPPSNYPTLLWNTIVREKIIYGFLSPMYVGSILSDKTLWQNSDWRPKILCLAGQPIKKEMLEIIGKLCDAVDINYGTTECNLVTTHRVESANSFINGCAGYPGYGVEIKVVDKKKQEVQRGVMGEILVRGPALTPGYLNNSSANASAFTSDHWFCTDDAGHFGSDGKLYMEGRQSDSIMRGAYVLYPGWLEQEIQKADKVKDVVVVPVPDKILHNEICAVVITDSGDTSLHKIGVENCGRDETDASSKLTMPEKPHFSSTNTPSSSISSSNQAKPMFDEIRTRGTSKSLTVPYRQISVQTGNSKVSSPGYISHKDCGTIEKQLRQHCDDLQILNENDSMRMVPKYYVFLDKFPLTNTGKINRREIRQMVTKSLGLD